MAACNAKRPILTISQKKWGTVNSLLQELYMLVIIKRYKFEVHSDFGSGLALIPGKPDTLPPSHPQATYLLPLIDKKNLRLYAHNYYCHLGFHGAPNF